MSHSSSRRGRPARYLVQALAACCRQPLGRGCKASRADHYVKCYGSVGFALALISHFLLGVRSLRELTAELQVNTRLGRLTGLRGISKAQLPKLLQARPVELWTPLLASLLRRVPAAQVPAGVRVLDTTFLAMGCTLFARQHPTVRCTPHTAGYKAGVVWDLQRALPLKLVCRAGQSNDAQYLDELLAPAEDLDGLFYLFDRGFRKYAAWDELLDRGAGFLTRAWHKLHFALAQQVPLDPASPEIVADEIGYVGGGRFRMRHRLRRITVLTAHEPIVFLTSDLERPAVELTELYRCRWQIELFFRWLKRVLDCRKSLGMSEAAALHTLCAALACYLLLLIFAAQVLPESDSGGLRGQKIALRILRSKAYEPPGRALLRCLGFS